MRKYWFSNRSAASDRALPASYRYGEPMLFRRHSDAAAFLHRATGDGDVLRDLRVWAGRRRAGTIRTDRELLEYAATCLVSKKLEVRAPLKMLVTTPEPIAKQTSEGTARRPARLIQRRDAPVEDEIDLDIEQQIAALRAAAKDGTPFCEQCARAQLEAAR